MRFFFKEVFLGLIKDWKSYVTFISFFSWLWKRFKKGEETVNLKLWLNQDGYAEALIDEMEEVFPHINFTFENVGATDSLTKLTLDGPAGISGDIMLMTHRSAFTGMNDNLLLPLGDEFGEMIEERILENAMNLVRNDGKYFGVPLTTESVALF